MNIRTNTDVQTLCTNKETKIWFNENLNIFHAPGISSNTLEVVNTNHRDLETDTVHTTS